MSEKMLRQWENRWNSFNPIKSLVHVNYWRPIFDGNIPPPLTVSVDPCGRCCLKCPHCNAKKVIKGGMMTAETVDDLVDLLVRWNTKSVCIGGGGEALMNPNTKRLIRGLQEGNIESSLITNGVYLCLFYEEIGILSYLGVSVDAATASTWAKIKGVRSLPWNAVSFESLINHMREVRQKYNYLDFTYKFLVLPANYKEIYAAAKLAKDIGCSNFHFRPGGAPWFERYKSYGYTERIRKSAGEQLDRARADFEDKDFRIYGVVSKFTDEWKVDNNFEKCYASFVTCTISPDGTVGLCCDRRGDPEIKLCKLNEAFKEWGGKRHKEIHEAIRIKTCPRCTYSATNEVIENYVIKDTTFQNFF